jgi:transposase InsO family protein
MVVKLASAIVAVGEGEALNVSELCRRHGVSRKTFYKWVGRYRAEALAGLQERPRRPVSNPNQTPPAVEERIVWWRKALADDGLDSGAVSIHWHLSGELDAAPSVATIHRVLVRRGQVTPQPHKRPKTSWRRFEAPAPNAWWQIDSTDWRTATGEVSIFNIIDDHSRLAARSRAVAHATSEQAWVTFCEAGEAWGWPAGTLSDNGLAFSGKLRGFEVHFEHKLREVGVRPFTGRPYHPQTTGKVERFQQTLKRWLRHQRVAGELDELQAQLDQFCWIYNYQRPHQGIGRATPISRWQASPASGPAPQPLDHPSAPSRISHTTVTAAGTIEIDHYRIHLGVEHQARPALVVIDSSYAAVFIDRQLIRALELDPTRSYQPSGRPRGGPHRPRLRS